MIIPPPPDFIKAKRILDIETYRNYCLVKTYDIKTKQYFEFEYWYGQPLNANALRVLVATCTNITFNGLKYDMLILSAALTGRFTNDMLKNLSDYIILTKPSPQPWQVSRDWGFEILELDHIDIIEVAPGQASLKIYGGRLHSKRMQDLPYSPDRILTREEMIATNLYCGNDLITTADLYLAVESDIDTRIELTQQYGVDMRSKSDAQIAETAFKKLLPGKIYPPQIPPGSRFFYAPAPFLQFTTPVMQQAFAMIQRVPFIIANSGQPEMPAELKDFTISIGSSVYRLGIGGLHSSEEKTAHYARDGVKLVDVDVVSYYPKIISILGMFPPQIGPQFLTIYNGWIDTRIAYKNKGEKKKAATFKILINGTFGKTGSKYSILYSPEMMIRTTITGQLSLLMLIEMLEAAGLSCVSANTDGVVIKCHESQQPLRDAIVKQWEAITGFETEANEYQALFSRDINNYLAFKGNEWKAKGAYADPGLAKNPTNIICVDAVKAYLQYGTPLEQTIRRCDDIRKFVTVRGVQGGGEWVHETIVADRVADKRKVLTHAGWLGTGKGTDERWIAPGHDDFVTLDAALRTLRAEVPRQYLGKAVRWYYGAGQKGHIAYASNGNLVARSEGAKPCMDLPDVLPPDIDYAWYIEEAQSLLKDLGVG